MVLNEYVKYEASYCPASHAGIRNEIRRFSGAKMWTPLAAVFEGLENDLDTFGPSQIP